MAVPNTWGSAALNMLAKAQIYDSWSDLYVREKAIDLISRIQNELKKENLETLDNASLMAMGARWWDEPNHKGFALLLLPLWMLSCIKEGTMVTDIFGETFKFKRKTADDDERMGCLSFGFLRDIREREVTPTDATD